MSLSRYVSQRVPSLAGLAGVAVLLGAITSALHPPLPAVGDMYVDNFDGRVIDVQMFAHAGDALLEGDFGTVYADPVNQAGPAQVAADAVIVRAAQLGPFPDSWLVIQAVICALVLLLSALLIKAVVKSSVRSVIAEGTGIAARFPRMSKHFSTWSAVAGMVLLTLWNVPITIYISGHWWQLLVFAGWVAGGVALAHRRPVLAGILVSGGIAWEPWAVFGGVFALWASRWRDAAVFLGSCVVVSLVVWLPFVVQPEFAFTDYEWEVRPDSAWSLVIEPGSPFPWQFRILQTLFIGTIVVAGTWFARIRITAGANVMGVVWWSIWVATVIVSARIATDVWFGQYYFAPMLVGVLALLSGSVVQAKWAPSGILLAAGTVLFAISATVGPFAAAGCCLLLLLFVGYLMARGEYSISQEHPHTAEVS